MAEINTVTTKKGRIWGFLLAFAVVLVALILWQTRIDTAIHMWAQHSKDTHGGESFWGFLSWLGEDHVQMAICLFFGIWYYKQSNYQMSRVWYLSVVIYLLSGVCVQILKHIIARPRPKMLPEYEVQWFEFGAKLHSMPSGHTMTTFAWLACLLPFYPKKVQAFLMLTAALIGFSRVGLGAHYTSDVLIGAVLGYTFGAWMRQKFKLTKEVQ